MHASTKSALFLTRVGFGVFLLVWGLNKLVDPAGTASVFAKFYGIENLGQVLSFVLGVAQVSISVLIIAGLFRTLSYGIGVAIHGISTFSTAPHLLLPFAEGSNLLFMAGLPVLLSAVGLFLARSHDTFWSLDEQWRRSRTSPDI